MLPESKSRYKFFQDLTIEVQQKLDYFNSIKEQSICLLFEYLAEIKDRDFLKYYKDTA